MEKFIPYEKLSKKEKARRNKEARTMWTISPVTRKAENPKAYNRQKARKWNDDSDFAPFYFLYQPLKQV